MDLHVSVQYLRSCMCRCLMTQVSMHVTLYLWILCIYKCTCACPYVTHVQVSLHVWSWFIWCVLSHGGAGKQRACLGQPQREGVQVPRSAEIPESPSQVFLSLPGPVWDSGGLFCIPGSQGCGAIWQLSPFRSCGFLWVWGSCPLQPPLLVLVPPRVQDTPPGPATSPTGSAGLGTGEVPHRVSCPTPVAC